MRIKGILLALGLMITIFFNGGSSEVCTTTNEIKDFENVSNTEIVVEEENNVEDEETVLENHIEQQKNVIEEQPKVTEEKKAEIKQTQKDTPKIEVSEVLNETPKIETPTKEEITSKQEEKTEIINQTQKEETPKQTTLTPSDLEYWCVAGGEHHIAGDRENEHGYYSSWDEANQAFENYTKGWESVQYKISQCSCGLYYFWAIK